MLDKWIRAFYILIIAIVVFLGGLLISKGMRSRPSEGAQPHPVVHSIEFQGGSAHRRAGR